nr:PREDICTED: ADAMTS-like protein 5 [Latimeria chalumnae]|eukprot:XP_014340354.1 PREDICTED: ADAMTS-like protein 5 [Latimeria chalumnae]
MELVLMTSSLLLIVNRDPSRRRGSPPSALPPRQRRQLRFMNEWSSWLAWSPCSRTCGGGAAVRTRRCITRNPLGESCHGDQRQYKACNRQDCPEGALDFRELQCSAYNNKPLLGNRNFQWQPFYGGPNPCELSCLAKGQRFYYSFGRVLDGTRCQPDSEGICINGKCLKVGCDQILGSEEKEDACRVCGGRNSTCLHYRSVYLAKSPGYGEFLHILQGSMPHTLICSGKEMVDGCVFGYNEVTMIPAGATHIKVTDNSRNYLALRNGEETYMINGNWEIDWPGVYNVLFTEPNSGIEYEYWLPRDRYNLYHGDRSSLWLHQQGATATAQRQTTTNTVQPTTTKRTTPAATKTTPAAVWRLPLHPNHQPQPRLERDETKTNVLPPPPRYDTCGKCRKVRGKTNRIKQYCEKDFVFRAKVLSKRVIGMEVCYDVQVIKTYKNNYPIVRREYLWVPNTCDCPQLLEGRDYILMARRHVNYERTLNRILLEADSFVRTYRPKEDKLLRDLKKQCVQYGFQFRTNLRG